MDSTYAGQAQSLRVTTQQVQSELIEATLGYWAQVAPGSRVMSYTRTNAQAAVSLCPGQRPVMPAHESITGW